MAAQQPVVEPLAQDAAFAPPLARPREAPIDKKWEITKLVLHGISGISSIIALGISGYFIGSDNISRIGLVGIFPALLALVWDAAEIITRACRKWLRGITPGAHVGISLIIWLTCLFFGGTLCLYAWDARNDEPCRQRQRPPDEVARYGDCSDADDRLTKLVSLATALAACVVLVGVAHLVLFVGACVDTHKHNRAKAYPVIMLAHPQFAGGGWQPMQQGEPAAAASVAQGGSAA